MAFEVVVFIFDSHSKISASPFGAPALAASEEVFTFKVFKVFTLGAFEVSAFEASASSVSAFAVQPLLNPIAFEKIEGVYCWFAGQGVSICGELLQPELP